MWKSRKNYDIKSNQDGVVSIFVTLILMVILSIVVIGFSQISRREVNAALNRELSTQAFYAAESGINDAYSIASAAEGTLPGALSTPLGSCDNVTYVNATSNIIDNPSNTSYTCLLVNVEPSFITLHPSAGQAEVEDLLAAGTPAPNFASLNIEWENDVGQTSVDNVGGGCNTRYAATDTFLPNSGSQPYDWSPPTTTCPPVLQVDIVPVNWAAGETENDLDNSLKTFFLEPHTINGSSGTVQWNNITAKGELEDAACNTVCNFNLTNMNAAPGGPYSEYYIKLMYIYGLPPTITLTGLDTSGQPINFKNGQIQIDSTGKSQDVLRRLKVVLPLAPSASLSPPSFAIQTNTTLCKRLEVGNIGGNDVDDVSIPVPTLAAKGLAANTPADVLSSIGPNTYNIDGNAPNFKSPPQTTDDPCDPY